MSRKPSELRIGLDPQHEAEKKWQSSGLTNAHAKKLKFKVLSPEQTEAHGWAALWSLLLPYFSPDGKATNYYRLRRLEEAKGFSGSTEKFPRYFQPHGTVPDVYLPPLLPVSWAEILSDPAVPLYITEGELKAACACALNLATLGLGGVDSWRARKKGLSLLPLLRETAWQGRSVTIVYDSDSATNPNVLRAQRQLAEELTAQGAVPSIATLPHPGEGKKQGLDDFLVANGKEAFEAVLAASAPFPESEALWRLNEEVVFIRNPTMVVERESGVRHSVGSFKDAVYANRHYLSTNEKGAAVKRPVAKKWLEWEQRFEVKGITYKPGQGKITEQSEWNSWPGWGAEPSKGSVAPWHWLMGFLFQAEAQEVRKWFERWLAYPLQHPGTKMFTSAVVWGVAHGTGKTLVAYTMRNIYGKNFVEIKNRDLRGSFNEWAANKQFIYGDEITGGDKRIDADYIKGLITQEQLLVNAKFLPQYTIPDCINYYFTSNHPDAFFLEDTDRRFFIHEAPSTPAAREFYQKYDSWYKSEEGIGALFHYLLNLDLGDFDPRAAAPMTRSKDAMIRDGKSDLGSWVSALKENPEHALFPLGEKISKECCLFTSAQLLRALDPDGSGRVKATGLGKELKRSMFFHAHGAQPVWTVTGPQRLWIVRDMARWAKSTPKQCADHFNSFWGPQGKKFE